MPLKNIIARNRDNIAFVVGNGLNRYPNNPDAISWDHLLLKLWQKFAPEAYQSNQIPKGITLTEFYDLLDLSGAEADLSQPFRIQKEAARMMDHWNFRPHHELFVARAIELNAPVLTTNFDMVLPAAGKLGQFYTQSKPFTDFYPWTTYYGLRQHQLPTDGFGVWYINGFVKYHRSIRLGLTHYMGCVDRARNYLHGGENNLFSSKDQRLWRGHLTWLHVIFNKDLCVFGLSLEENEVFIRWLLIERARYFKKFPQRAKKGWYISVAAGDEQASLEGKKMFMRSVGLEYIEVKSYDDIYQVPWERQDKH